MVGKIRVAIADDHVCLRQGLKGLLGSVPEFTIVGEAEDGWEIFDICKKEKPQVVVMDLTMPRLNGLNATKKIKVSFPETKVLILSMHSQDDLIIQALQAGASGYLVKQSAFEEIIRAIKIVADNKTYLSPSVQSTVVANALGRQSSSSSQMVLLSDRERLVLQLIAEGNSSKEIAEEMKVSNKTVDKLRSQIVNKLEIRSVAGLTKYAIRHGLTVLD